MLPDTEYGPWNPGLESQTPRELRHLATIFRPEHAFTSYAAAAELRGLTGFSLSELVAFRPQRLALHELLVRITADFAVPDGTRIEDLGLNFRKIARLLLSQHLEPQMDSIAEVYRRARGEVQDVVESALSRLGRSWGPEEIAEIERQAAVPAGSADGSGYRCLARVMSALFATQGAAWGTKDLIASMAVNFAGNEYGAECIGRVMTPMLHEAAREQGCKLLPRQEHPVVINTKGPSASGKSTLRPLQKKLAGEIGVEWSDFAIISPDIWRKQLLDYASLGAAYKYAGAFTSDEVQIIDQKLDRYMAGKNLRGEMSHLLIDRFRFDSFAPDSNEAGSNLLTRFGQALYLFFVITPPEMLVERAWKRGLEFGRYKAVDDTLAHAVEAYSGIPNVFFTWVRRADKRIRFEFLDNTVRLGERPRTVAFGDNETFNILDVKAAIDVERYARIDVDATGAEFLYPDRAWLLPGQNLNFLRRCVQSFHRVAFAEQASGLVYLRMERGRPILKNEDALRRAMRQPDTLAAIRDVAPEALQGGVPDSQRADFLAPQDGGGPPTLGQWGRLT